MLGGVLAVVGAVAAAFGGDDNAITLTYRLEKLRDAEVTVADARAVNGVLARRLESAGYTSTMLKADGATTITVTVWSDKPGARDEICRLLDRPGTLEFRVCASEEETRKWRAISKEPGGALTVPQEFAWLTYAEHQDCLVLTPERPIAAKLEKARSEHPSDDTVVAQLQSDLERTRREEVFTGDQLGRAEMHRAIVQGPVVYFEFREDRKKAFADFTERHVGQSLAIILDGKVNCIPTIKSRLPGAGIIEGGGATGFTEGEAQMLANVLTAGALPARLVRVEPEKK